MKLDIKTIDVILRRILKGLLWLLLAFVVFIGILTAFRMWYYKYTEENRSPVSYPSFIKESVSARIMQKDVSTDRFGNNMICVKYGDSDLLIWKIVGYEGVTPSRIKVVNSLKTNDSDFKMWATYGTLQLPAFPFTITYKLADQDAYNLTIGYSKATSVDTLVHSSKFLYGSSRQDEIVFYTEGGLDKIITNLNAPTLSNFMLVNHNGSFYVLYLSSTRQTLKSTSLLDLIDLDSLK